jgi:hypothetical protein
MCYQNIGGTWSIAHLGIKPKAAHYRLHKKGKSDESACKIDSHDHNRCGSYGCHFIYPSKATPRTSNHHFSYSRDRRDHRTDGDHYFNLAHT